MNHSMKPYWTLKNFAIAMLLLLSTSTTYADEWSGHIGGFAGFKALHSSDWPDLNKHFAMGFIVDIKKDSWPISIVLDILDTGGKYSHDGLDDLGHTTEFLLGVRKIIHKQNSKIQPYVGGGVSLMYAEQEIASIGSKVTQDDRGTGGWLGAGMYYVDNPGFVFGLDARYSYGKVDLFGKEREAGGVFAGVTGTFQF
jgi:hypothetical protein